MNLIDSSTHDLLVQILGKQADRVPANTPMALLRSMHATEMVNQYHLTPAMARRLAAALEIGRRATEDRIERGRSMVSSADIFRHFSPRMRDLKFEQFWVAHLDGKHRLQSEHMISQGTLTSAPVHPREVFSPAIRLSSAALVLVHNHPSGDPFPSADDLEITKRLASVGSVVGIRLVDHVIIGDACFASLADKGLMGG